MFLNLELSVILLSILLFSKLGIASMEADNKTLHSLKTLKAPFPQWLKDFTHLNDWPGMNPPYIPLNFIDFSKVPDIPRYSQADCPNVSRIFCSFDCHKCREHDDIVTCDKLSQTFDDGPTPATSQLLHSLKHKTTFFTLGVNIVEYPDIYRSILNNGHDTASHTWSHAHLPSLTNEEIVAQLEWTMWVMNATGHHIPRYFRPPFGGVDARVRAIARQFGLQSVLWDHDTFDWQVISGQRSESDVFHDVIQWKNKDEAGLILEHDTTYLTTNIGNEIEKIIGTNQKTVAQCVGGSNYILQYDS